MTNSLPRRRRLGRDFARVGLTVSTTMFLFGLGTWFGPGQHVASAAPSGALTVTVGSGPTAGQPLASGGSATVFALALPSGAACSGDSVAGGYRVQSFMVPASVDVGTLTFGLTGPNPSGIGVDFRQPLYSSTGSIWVNKTTAVTTGLIINTPAISFAWVDTGGTATLPPGVYKLGYACTKNAGALLDKYWEVQLTISASATDVPSGLTWAVPAVIATTTTTSVAATTSTTVGPTTSLGTTTTSVARTTTTVAGASTTTSTVAGGGVATSTTANVASGGGTGNYGGGSNIVSTGSSPTPLIIWGLLLLVFGRMALLLARPLRVLPPESR